MESILIFDLSKSSPIIPAINAGIVDSTICSDETRTNPLKYKKKENIKSTNGTTPCDFKYSQFSERNTSTFERTPKAAMNIHNGATYTSALLDLSIKPT